MQRTVLITGSTDGIGLETAKMLVSDGWSLLIHGRNPDKLDKAKQQLSTLENAGPVEGYLADLSRMSDIEALAKAVAGRISHLDVLINNAGVYKAPNTETADGLDIRFAVNTIAPYLLTQKLRPLMGREARVINLSSAAQAPVDPDALTGRVQMSDGEAYAQSKLALTIWSQQLAAEIGEDGPAIIAVNPGSMLGSKMVKEAYGVAGGDIRIGADILTRLATDEQFKAATGRYYDNDSRQFAEPHPQARDPQKVGEVMGAIAQVISGR